MYLEFPKGYRFAFPPTGDTFNIIECLIDNYSKVTRRLFELRSPILIVIT